MTEHQRVPPCLLSTALAPALRAFTYAINLQPTLTTLYQLA
jgi:hypothetical protein